MQNEKPTTQMKKGVLELCVLSMVVNDPMYSGDILKALKTASLLTVEGTLYPLLNRLKDDGHLVYSWEESKEGPPRKYFSITDRGRAYCETLKQQWNSLVVSVNQIINL